MDVITMLRWRVLSKKHLSVLLQMFLIFLISSVCTFAGPLAKVSLRVHQTLIPRELEVLKAWKGNGAYGNSFNDEVKKNTTMIQLDEAGFPYDQLLDYLPPFGTPWKYLSQEWDPTWRAACTFEHDVILKNLTATGNVSFQTPIDIFPAYKQTYDPIWFNKSHAVRLSLYNGEKTFNESGTFVKDLMLWFLVQTNPEDDNRMFTNEGSMQICFSALHAKGLQALNDGPGSVDQSWRLNGTAEHASYSRMTCEITKKPGIVNDDSLPWLWSNKTQSIIVAYSNFWTKPLAEASLGNMTVSPPHPHELFRFYQAHMASINTWFPRPSTKILSVWTDTVQLSTVCLIIIIAIFILGTWLAGRYLWFLRCNRLALEKTYIPDGKMEWMVHNARLAEEDLPTSTCSDKNPLYDCDYFQRASFGTVSLSDSDTRLLPRVYTNPALPEHLRHKATAAPISERNPQSRMPRIVLHALSTRRDGLKEELEQTVPILQPCKKIELAIQSGRGNSRASISQATPYKKDLMAKATFPSTSSATLCETPPKEFASSPNPSIRSARSEPEHD
jgi:hypothetical protein